MEKISPLQTASLNIITNKQQKNAIAKVQHTIH